VDEYVSVAMPTLGAGTPIDCRCPSATVDTLFAGAFSAPAAFQAAVGPAHFQPKRHKRYLEDTLIDLNSSDNHLQGVQRAGDYLLVTGADWTESRAHLFVVRAKRDAAGVPTGGELVRVACIDEQRAHPGGCQRLGNLLIVPVEGKKIDSCARFFDVSNPAAPLLVGGASTITRAGRAHAGAAAVTCLPGGRFLAGVWWDEGAGKKAAMLDLYLSAGTDVRQGFSAQPFAIDFGKTLGREVAYQSIAFLCPERQAAPGGGMSLWMVGLWNTKQSTSNYFKGDDVADLFRLTIPDPAGWGPAANVGIVAKGSRTFKFGRRDGNFSAAAGVDVEPDGRLAVYAAHHWRDDRKLRFSVTRSGK
jgi:hypothetical protein